MTFGVSSKHEAIGSETSRRTVLAGLAASVAAPTWASPSRLAGEPAPANYGPGRMVTVRGKRLYVEVSGPDSAPPLVFIHGGPGTGSWDFGRYQKARLSSRIRLIQFDQRGALRSDPIGEDEPFTL